MNALESRRVAAALFAGIVLGAGVVFAGFATAAHAGSDAPTPYTVDAAGITLPAGVTFPDNGHVNVRTTSGDYGIHFEGKCVTRTDAECAGARHAAAQFIGRSFLPWSAFGVDPQSVCVVWVQVSIFDEHFGEGGQVPVGGGCATPTPEPTPEPTPTPTPDPSDTPIPADRVSVVTDGSGELARTGLSPAASWVLMLALLGVVFGATGVAMRSVSRRE